jgi:nitrile hydratase subunit beta
MDGAHDMGGMHGFGAVARPGSELPYHGRWEPRVFALHLVTGFEGLGAGPGGRQTREEMDPASYLAASYFQRWTWSAEQRLLRKGTIKAGEVEAMMDRLASGEAAAEHTDPAMAERIIDRLQRRAPMDPPPADARFAPGDRVRVSRMRPPGHTRCPRYVRGAAGTIERVRGADRLPDLTTYGHPAEPEPVYAVRFASGDVWGPGEEPPFTVLLDLWDSYLEPA